jgi:hypothetical protein
MDPHDVLGVPPTATRDEIETAYRAALRRSHPDLHHAQGPEAVASAEAETRRLNEAVARLRAEWLTTPGGSSTRTHAPRDGTPGPTATAGSGTGRAVWDDERFGFRAGPGTDWFGNPLDRRIRAERVECPFCRLPFDDAVVYRSHLAHEHGYGDPVIAPRHPEAGERRPLADRLVWLGWIPLAWLWFAVVLVVYWALVLGVLGDSPVASALVWVGVVGYVIALALHHHFRHRSS